MNVCVKKKLCMNMNLDDLDKAIKHQNKYPSYILRVTLYLDAETDMTRLSHHESQLCDI